MSTSEEEIELENPEATIKRLKARILELEADRDDLSAKVATLQDKNVELKREVVQLHREAETVPYPGPSTHCAMCKDRLADTKDVEKGLCGKCLPVFDEMYPHARIRNPTTSDEPNLRPVP